MQNNSAAYYDSTATGASVGIRGTANSYLALVFDWWANSPLVTTGWLTGSYTNAMLAALVSVCTYNSVTASLIYSDVICAADYQRHSRQWRLLHRHNKL
jgi:hypothetical protein